MSNATGWQADRLRDELVGLGFADDGVRLRGPLAWTHPTEGIVVARVEIELDQRFPFAPPQVRVLDPGIMLEITFHIDRPTHPGAAGNLCLWEDTWPVDEAPWIDPDRLLERIADWLEQTAAGWPDDDVCDLERYLEPDFDTFVLYDAESLTGLVGSAVCTWGERTRGTVVVANTAHRIKARPGRPGRNRKDRRLAWVDDLGEVRTPVRRWRDIEESLSVRAATIARHIALGAVNLLLLRYQRGMQHSVLALHVRQTADGIEVRACESADKGVRTRQLRAGAAVSELAEAKIAIVGCGAVGSFTAAQLFRSGARHLTLIDHERLRPGNVVRHLAGLGQVGHQKADAVRDCLASIDPAVGSVHSLTGMVTTAEEAAELLRHHRVVVDATGSARASSLLVQAAAGVGPDTGHVVISACVQREGDIARVDRLPPRSGDSYLPPLSPVEDSDQLREYGCGSPVSRTPPGAVIDAADLACQVVIDEVTEARELPASLANVRRAQPEPPYTRIGLVSSEPLPSGSG
ncbi:ThiF family adenylyltransferase [Streptomyces bacillaris]|uniref:ThiF family adenylyltransferase n=1 Tax=Streptomyces bacillaris TaxID=68179 RepID=UPI0035E381F5